MANTNLAIKDQSNEDLINFCTTDLNDEDFAKAFSEAQKNGKNKAANDNQVQYMNLNQTSREFIYGKDQINLPTGSLVLIPPTELKHGFTRWNKNQKDSVMASVTEPFPAEPQGEGWQESWSFTCSPLDEPSLKLNMEKTALYQSRFVGYLTDIIASKPSAKHRVPIGKIGITSRVNKFGKTQHEPSFDVVTWLNHETGELLSGQSVEELLASSDTKAA